jgi:hypothetical protein
MYVINLNGLAVASRRGERGNLFASFAPPAPMHGVAEGMGSIRGDRSRPDDYCSVYAEYYHAQEAYHRLVSVGEVLLWIACVAGVQPPMYPTAVYQIII